MLVSFFKTVLLLLFVILSLRLMGKRQIGQLQPSELVITILLSQVASTPMQDDDIPLLQTLVVIGVLTGLEILISVFALKSKGVRTVFDGSAVQVIENGKIDQRQLRRLRYTIDDLLEGLRQKDVFDPSAVDTAVVETNGTLSVLLKKDAVPPTNGELGRTPPCAGMPVPVITDGKIDLKALSASAMDLRQLRRVLGKEALDPAGIFLMTVDRRGGYEIVKKEGEQ